MLDLAYIILALGIAGIGIGFNLRIFNFTSGMLFIFLGITNDEIFLIVVLVILGLVQIFNTFFEWNAR